METPQVYRRSDGLNSREKQDTKLVIILPACASVCVRACVRQMEKMCCTDSMRLSRSEARGQDSRRKLNQGCETARTAFVLVNVK